MPAAARESRSAVKALEVKLRFRDMVFLAGMKIAQACIFRPWLHHQFNGSKLSLATRALRDQYNLSFARFGRAVSDRLFGGRPRHRRFVSCELRRRNADSTQ